MSRRGCTRLVDMDSDRFAARHRESRVCRHREKLVCRRQLLDLHRRTLVDRPPARRNQPHQRLQIPRQVDLREPLRRVKRRRRWSARHLASLLDRPARVRPASSQAALLITMGRPSFQAVPRPVLRHPNHERRDPRRTFVGAGNPR
jgi:hypothetical protein